VSEHEALTDEVVPEAEHAESQKPAEYVSSVTVHPVVRQTATTAHVTSAASSPALDEASLMATMREVRRGNPLLSLQLAREGNERFKNSPDAAERSWTVVKSLSELGRQAEALTEARSMFEKYKGTPWANDVHRHMLMNPPTHPLERGYGKELEGE
jgi:hypothetical protein